MQSDLSDQNAEAPEELAAAAPEAGETAAEPGTATST